MAGIIVKPGGDEAIARKSKIFLDPEANVVFAGAGARERVWVEKPKKVSNRTRQEKRMPIDRDLKH